MLTTPHSFTAGAVMGLRRALSHAISVLSNALLPHKGRRAFIAATEVRHAPEEPTMHPVRSLAFSLLAAALLMLTPAAPTLAGDTLRIGLNEDPDVLDPAQGGFFVDRIVFAATCDKLIDTDAKNDFVPQLATGWQ